MQTVSKQILQMLVCPVTKTQVTYDQDTQELISQVAGLAYPIRNGIPIMLADEARVVDEDRAKLVCPQIFQRS